MTKEITIGYMVFQIKPLSIAATRQWREKYGQQLIDAFSIFSQAEKIELSDTGSVVNLMSSFGSFVLNMPDLVVDAVMEYVPAMQKEREVIEGIATYEEFGSILIDVLKVAYPFGSLASNVTRLAGVAQRGTLKSSR